MSDKASNLVRVHVYRYLIGVGEVDGRLCWMELEIDPAERTKIDYAKEELGARYHVTRYIQANKGPSS